MFSVAATFEAVRLDVVLVRSHPANSQPHASGAGGSSVTRGISCVGGGTG